MSSFSTSDALATGRKVMRIFGAEFRRMKTATISLVLLVVGLEILSQVYLPLFNKRLVDMLATTQVTGEGAAQHALAIVAMLVGLNFLSTIFYTIASLLHCHVQTQGETNVDRASFAYLLGHSHRFFSDSFAGALVRKIRRLSDAFGSVFESAVWRLIPVVVTLPGILFVMFRRDATIGFLVTVWAIIFAIVSYKLIAWRMKYIFVRSEKDSIASGTLSDAISNAITIKSFSGAAYEQKRFFDVSEDVRKAWGVSWRYLIFMENVQGVLVLLVDFLVLSLAVRSWARGTLTVGDFVLFYMYIKSLDQRLRDMGFMLRRVFDVFGDAKEMVDILEMPHEVQDVPNATTLRVSKAAISFRNVSFAYGNNRPLLSRLSLEVAPHEKIACVGPSGAGKSTIMKLLFRFFDVTSGRILIDGQDISMVTQDSLRDAIAFVPQEPLLFHRSLMENIRYGRRDATDEEVREAAKLAHCDEFIRALPKGYDTEVGERGVKLSGGERQRVAIARAILKDAPILVLDEATSSLDSESEALIQDALRILMQGKTVLVIAHRLSTIMQMDRILVIQDGRIIDEGAHEELVQKAGMYRTLWEIQAGGFTGEKTEERV